MSVIEPLAQSDRANFNLLLFRLRGTLSRVSALARPDILSGEKKCHDRQPGILRSADYGNLSKLQKRDGNNESYADSARQWL